MKLSPQSLPLLQTLATYYQAAGQAAKLTSTYQAMARSRPEDAKLRLQLAGQLLQAREIAAALDLYREAIRKDPSALASNATAIQQAFDQANQLTEYVKLLDEVGLKAAGQRKGGLFVAHHPVQRTPSPVRPPASPHLLGKAWEAFPNDREMLVYYLYRYDGFWTIPESYAYARAFLFPSTSRVDPWSGFSTATYIGVFRSASGEMTSLVSRFLDSAGRMGKLDELAGDIEQAIARSPGWRGGRAILGLVRIRQGASTTGGPCCNPSWPTPPTPRRVMPSTSWAPSFTRSPRPPTWRWPPTRRGAIPRRRGS